MRNCLFVLTVFLAASACKKLSNTVSITNGSEATLRDINVSVCDSSWTIAELAPGESREFTASYSRDDDFTVKTGNLTDSFGYVTHGMTGDRAVITFVEDSIQFEQTVEDY